MKKQYVVFGAGRFGRSIAVTLQSRGCEVIVVDRDPEVIENIADEVSYAICANVEDPDSGSHGKPGGEHCDDDDVP